MYIYNKFQFNDLGLQTHFRAVKVAEHSFAGGQQ